MAEEFKVKVGVEVDTSKLDSQIGRIKPSEKIKCDVELNDASVQHIVDQLNNGIKAFGKNGNEIKFTADVTGLKKDVANAVKGVTGKSAANNIKVNADTSNAKKELSGLTAVIEKSENGFEKLRSELAGMKFNTSSIDAFMKELENSLVTVEKVDASFTDDHTFTLNVKGLDEAEKKIQAVITAKEKLDEEGNSTGVWNTSTKVSHNLYDRAAEEKKAAAAAKQAAAKEAAAVKQAKAEEAAAAKQAAAEAKAAAQEQAAAEKQVAAAAKQAAKEQAAAAQIAANAKTQRQKLIDTYKAKKQSDVDVDSKYNKINNPSDDLIKAYDAYKNAKKNLFDTENFTDDIVAVNQYNAALETVKNQLSIVANKERDAATAAKAEASAQKEAAAAMQLRSKANNLSMSMDAWLKRNSAAAKTFGGQIRSLQAELKSCDATRFSGIQSEFKTITTQAEIIGKTGLSMGDRLKMQFTKLSSYFGAASVIMTGIQTVKEGFQNVLDVDTKLTELYRVTDFTSSQYSDVYDTLTTSAQKYGATLTDLISQTADWSRAGFSDPDTAARLSEITSVYQHIADLDANTSMENLLTAYKGFEPQLKKQFGGDAAAAAGHIADVYNEIDNNYATTAADIGEAVKRSASALSLAGNSLEETAGMVTGITEVTQDPEKAGNSLKVLSMRLRGMKGELQDLGEETDENVENLSQMQGKVLNLTHGKVNIFDNAGDFKSTYEIMQGIADIYDDLTDSDKADLLETIAGKNRANEVAALIQNWDRVAQATESAENSAGSAMAEQEKYANSLQGRLNSLTSSLQTISNTALDSGFLKGLVSGATDVINAVNKIIDAIDIIPTVATAAGAAVSLSGKGMFKVITDETGKSKMRLNGWAKNIVSYFKDVSSGVVQVFGEAFNKINTELGNDNTFNFNAKKIKGANGGTGFVANLDSDLSKLKEYKYVIETLKKNQKDGQEINFDFAMDKYLSNASASAQEFAKSWDLSNDALGEFSKKQIEATGVISKTSSSMTNAKNIISAYNNLVDESGQAQSKFASAISTFNPQLGNYLYGLKSGEASLSGYGVQLAIATVKTFALEAATLALNAALTFGISMLVSAGVSALMSWINRADELSDKIDDITTKYKQQKEELQSSKKTIDDVSDSYEKLSQGVNPTTNDNITLSNDEYKEYIDIVNQIADTFPTLVSGYDAQGNAILSCAGNVDKLNAAYKEMANNNYDDVLKEANNFIKDFKNKSDDLESDNEWGQFWDTVPFVSNDMRKDSYDTLKDLISDTENFDDKMSDLSFHADWDFDLDAYDKLNEIAQAFENAGIERKNFFESDGDFVKRAITENKKVAKQIVGDYEEQMKAATEDMQTATEAYFGKAFLNGKYSNISKNMQNAMNQMIPNLGYDYFSQFKNAEDMYGSLDKILTSVNDVNGKDKTFETYFDLQAKVNNGECTVGEYVNNLNDVSSVIDGLDVDKNAKKALKLSLQLDDNDIKKQYTSFKNSLIGSGVDKDIAKKFADGLNAQELEAAVKLKAEGKIDFKNLNLDDFKKQIKDAAKYAKAMKFTIDMDAEIDSLDKFNTALSESKTAGGLATETIDAIKSRFKGLSSYNPAALFEETANGIRLNTTEYQKLNKEIINNKKAEAQQTLDTLNDKYNELGESIKNCSDASKMADLLTEQENIRLQINDVAELAAQYDGLTSKYKAWQDAESAGSDRDMYESVLSGFKEVDDELSRGWLDDASKAFIDLFSNGELKSIDDYTNRWKTLGDTIQGTTYSAKDFFTQDDDGNSTNDGVYNFLEAADQLGMGNIQRDGNGEIISFDFGVNGEKAVADAMGISEELVQIIERASEDAGFTINMDGARTQYADMANAAQDAADAILKAKQENSDLLKDFSTEDLSFNFEETTLDGVKGQLDKAKTLLDSFKQDGKLNLDSTEAQNALQVVQTLQAQWDQLNKPAYMSIDTTQVDKSLQEPIKKMQEFDNLSTQKNQMVLAGVDTSDIDKQMDDIVNELEELDPEIKAQLGIDGKTPDELKQDLENDDIRMKGELDIQAKMSGDLSILSDKALLDAGIIDEKEFKRRVSVETEVDADVDTSKAESETEEKTESFFDKAKKKIDEAGKTIGEKFGEAKESVSNGIDSAKQGIEDACKSFEESPIGQTLSKIGDSLGAATSKVGDSFSGVVDKVSKPFKKIMGTIGEGVEGFASDKWSEFTDWLSSVGDGISQFADDASKFGSGIGDGFSDFINSIGDFFGNQWDDISENAQPFVNALSIVGAGISKFGEIVGEFAGDKISNLFDTIDSGIKSFGDWASGGIDWFGDWASGGLEDFGKGLSGFLDGVNEFLEDPAGNISKAASDFGQSIIDSIRSSLPRGINDIIDSAGLFFDNNPDIIQDTISGFFDGVSAAIDTAVEGCKETVKSKIDEFRSGLPDWLNGVIDGIAGFISDPSGAISGLIDNVKNSEFGKAAQDAVQSVQDVIDKISNIEIPEIEIPEPIQSVMDAFNSIGEFFSDDDAVAKVVDSINNIDASSVANSIDKFFNSIGEAIDNAVDTCKETVKSKIDEFRSGLPDWLNGLIDGFGEFTSNPTDFLSGLAENIGTAIDNVFDDIKNKIDEKIEEIRNGLPDWVNGIIDGASYFFGHDEYENGERKSSGGGKNSEVNVTGKSSVEDISSALGELDDKQIEVTADVIGKIDVEQLQSAMCDLDDKSVEAIAKAIGEGDVQGLKSAIQNIPDKKVAQAIAKAFGYNDVDALCGAIDGLNPKVVEAIAKAFGISDVESLDDVVSGLDDNTVNAIAKAIGEGDVNALQSIINNMHGNSVNAEANTSGQPEKVGFLQSIINALTGNSVPVDADTSSGQSAVSGFQSMIDGLHGTTVTITATIAKAASDLWGMITGDGVVDGTAHASGTANVNGTAYANGTTGRAFKQGNWGTKENGVALGGELGTELLVRDGRWYTIGEDSAEFFGYKKGDIIFNADQTREIFEKGKITHGNGRGKALASGTAFGRGSGGIGPANTGSTVKTNKSSSSGSKSSSSSNSNSSANEEAEKTEETLDWIETALDRVERAISRLDKTATSTYKNWTKRGTALNDQISQTRREIDLQNQAYNRYIQQANSVGLDAGYAAKVRDGTIDIEKITDEDLNNKISEYKQWYEKALDCLDAIDDLRESESKLYEQRFENVSTKYDGYLGVIQHEKDMLDEFVSQTETAGYITSGKYYDAMSANAKKQQEELKKQRDEMISELNNAVNSGTIEKYSESWYSMVNSVDEVTKSIEECNTSLLEYEKNLRELDWQVFDLIQDKISKVADESEFLINLMSNKKLYEDNGQLTDEGMASMGQYGVKYNVYMAQANKYAKKIKELQADLAKDPYNQDIANQLQEYIEAQQEAILNAEDMKNSIKDMVSDGIDKELDSLQKLIDKRNDALDAAKD